MCINIRALSIILNTRERLTHDHLHLPTGIMGGVCADGDFLTFFAKSEERMICREMS